MSDELSDDYGWTDELKEVVEIGRYLKVRMEIPIGDYRVGVQYRVVGKRRDSNCTFVLADEQGDHHSIWDRDVEPPQYCDKCIHECKSEISCSLFEEAE